jgi:hypothetical protein
MASDVVDERPPRPLLTLGPVDLVRVQVGYRAQPDGPAHQQFLIDLPVPPGDADQDAFDESWVLSALEPVLRDGSGPPRHYSLHVHRWHTSWGPSPGALEIGLLVTAGTRSAALSDAWQDVVTSGAAHDGRDEYDVVVGLVDGYARSVRVRHVERIEVSDSVGSE